MTITPTGQWTERIVNAVIAASVAVTTTLLTSQYQRIVEYDEGRAVSNLVGYRYFHALLNTTEEKDTGDGSVIAFGAGNSGRYFRTLLEDIQENIRLLLTNPVFVGDERNAVGLSLIQNSIAVELSLERKGPQEGTMRTMCTFYLGPESAWEAVGVRASPDVVRIRESARSSCQAIGAIPP